MNASFKARMDRAQESLIRLSAPTLKPEPSKPRPLHTMSLSERLRMAMTTERVVYSV